MLKNTGHRPAGASDISDGGAKIQQRMHEDYAWCRSATFIARLPALE
jgi:hypothetical protein